MPEPHLEDPRDLVHDADLALRGVTSLLGGCDEPLDRRGLQRMLELVSDRLAEASERMAELKPRR
ncbi:MAG: hypothetical protein AAF618_00790 [Pseudomonadota bacterium]